MSVSLEQIKAKEGEIARAESSVGSLQSSIQSAETRLAEAQRESALTYKNVAKSMGPEIARWRSEAELESRKVNVLKTELATLQQQYVTNPAPAPDTRPAYTVDVRSKDAAEFAQKKAQAAAALKSNDYGTIILSHGNTSNVEINTKTGQTKYSGGGSLDQGVRQLDNRNLTSIADEIKSEAGLAPDPLSLEQRVQQQTPIISEGSGRRHLNISKDITTIIKENPQLEGKDISNIMHGQDDLVTFGYRSEITGKYYSSQDEAYLQGAAKEPGAGLIGAMAGYTGKATIDPRSKFFKPVEGDGLLTNKQSTKPAGSALPDGTDSYTLTFADGKKLTGLTKQQADEYIKTFELGEKVAQLKRQQQRDDVIGFIKEAKAQGFTLLDIRKDGKKETIPIDNAFGRLITGGEATISYQDPKLKQARIDFVNTRRAQKKWLKDVKESGAGFISIKSSLGTQVTPVETAWDAIKKAPADAQISTRLPVAEKGIGPDRQTRDIIKYEQGRREISQDPLSQATFRTEKEAEIETNPTKKFIKQLEADALAFIGGTINTQENISVGINRGVGNLMGTNESRLAKFPEPDKQFYLSKNWVGELQGNYATNRYYKPTDIGFGIKVDLPTWQSAKYAISKSGEYMHSVGPVRAIAQGLFSYGTLNPETGIKAVPLRYVKAAIPVETKIMPGLTPKAPRTPTIIGAPQVPDVTPTITARGIAFGYGGEKSVIIGGKYGEAGGNKPFLGKPTASKLGIEGITPPTGQTNALELASYNKLQRKIIDDAFKYGEETGVVKPDTIKLQKLEDRERKKQVRNLSDIKLESKTPNVVEGVPLEAGQETQNVFGGAADIQKKGFVESVKGSLITNMIAGWVKRPQGDLMDLEAVIPRHLQREAASLQRDVSKLQVKAIKETNPQKRDKIYNKLKTKQDELKLKQNEILANADAAADYIVQNVKVGEGKTLVRKGFNIYIADADYSKPRFNIEIPDKKFYQSDMIAAHGTDTQGAKGIMRSGADPSKRPYGEPAFFATPSQQVLQTFASQRVVLGKLASSDILLYKNIPKRDRLQILKESRQQSYKTKKPKWMTYQETLSEYAKQRGYKGVTKPYHTTNPLSSKYEVIVFEKGVFKPTEIVKPTGYEGVAGTEKEIINIVTSKEELNDVLGDISGNVGKPFGDKWPDKIFKAKIGSTGKKLELHTVPYQSVAKAKAISGIQSAASIAEDFSHDELWKRSLMGSYRVVKSPKAHRYDKDPLDFYMLTYRNVKAQVEKGDIKGARESVQTALAMRKYYAGTDFIQGARQYKNFDTITPDKEPSPSFSQRIESTTGRSPIIITSSRSGKENKSEKTTSPSVRTSTRSNLGNTSVISPNLIMSSTRSTRSPSSTRSVKQSPASAKSATSVKPSPLSSKSPRSFQSPKSPTSPLSLRSPRPTSPASPKSPPSPRPTSIISPPSPKIISPPSPKISPLISPIDLKVPPPRTIRIIRPPRTRIDKQKPNPPKGREDFFASSHAAEVMGFRKTKGGKPTDFDYGDVKTARLVEQDIKLTTKGRDSFISSGKTRSFISTTKKGLIEPEKKRQKNIFGQGGKWKKVF